MLQGGFFIGGHKMLDIMVITSPRAKPYLLGTLDELRTQFDIIPHVFAEPNTPKPPGRTIWHQNLFRCGMVCNWYYSARYMLENSDEPYIMCCEDDIRFMPEAGYKLRVLLSTLHKDKKVGFVSPYCSLFNAYSVHLHCDSWVQPRIGRGGWCGSLCLVFPRKSLEYVVSDWLRFREHTIVNYPKPLHLDYAIGRVLTDAGYKIITHHPTLVLHTGDISTFPPNNAPGYYKAREPAI